MKGFLSFFILVWLLPGPAAHGRPDSLRIPGRPAPYRFVNDLASSLSRDQKQKLEIRLDNFYMETHDEIVVVTLDSLSPLPLEEIGTALFTQWGLAGLNQGRVLLILANLKSRQVIIRIGPGLLNRISDDICLRVLNTGMFPYFSRQLYYQGFRQTVELLRPLLLSPSQQQELIGHKPSHTPLFWVLVALLLLAGGYWFYRTRKVSK